MYTAERVLQAFNSLVEDEVYATYNKLQAMNGFILYLYNSIPIWHNMNIVDLNIRVYDELKPLVIAIIDLFNEYEVNHIINLNFADNMRIDYTITNIESAINSDMIIRDNGIIYQKDNIRVFESYGKQYDKDDPIIFLMNKADPNLNLY